MVSGTGEVDPVFVDTGAFAFKEPTMAKTETTLHARIPPPYGRTGAGRPLAGRAGAGVRTNGAVDQELGRRGAERDTGRGSDGPTTAEREELRIGFVSQN